MKKITLLFMLSLIIMTFVISCAFMPAIAEAKTDLGTAHLEVGKNQEMMLAPSAKASMLIDFETGSVIWAKNEKERLPIASMMKIMTILIAIEEINAGNLGVDDEVTISDNAHSQGGSQVFLDSGATQKAGALIESIIVASANDSCVAIAEHIGGSVENFLQKMNDRAKELKMEDTHFANCTGLPSSENFSSAKDVAIMLKELCKHPLYFEYSSVWLKDFEHASGRTTTMTNTNKLVRFYQGCDGGKTGFTNEAGFCLAATAKRNDMRLISVVIGEKDSKTRFKEVSEMLNYGFSGYENKVYLDTETNIENKIELKRCKQNSAQLVLDKALISFSKRGDEGSFKIKYDLPSSLKAPLKAGEKVGKAYLIKDGVVVCEANIVLKKNLDRSSILDDLKRIFGPKK